MKAYLKNYRQSPRKVRLVTDLVKGKSVTEAITALSFLPKRAALPIKTLILSAVANAKNNDGLNPDRLIISNITVDKGVVLKRRLPRARGMATPINKRSSHVKVELKEKTK